VPTGIYVRRANAEFDALNQEIVEGPGSLIPLWRRGALALGLLEPDFTAAADAVAAEVQRQPLNVAAIVMFLIFVVAALGITYWAARRTKSKGFTLYMVKALISGRGDEVIDLARSNLWR
jgi:hypothetical protein